MFHLNEQTLGKLDAAGLVGILRASPCGETAAALLPAVAALPTVNTELVRAFLDAAALPDAAAQCLGLLAERERLAAAERGQMLFATTGQWLLAELTQQGGDTAAASALWQRIIDAGAGGQMAEALLALARLQLRAGAAAGALDALRRALRTELAEQSFLTRAERLYRTICAKLQDADPLQTAADTDAALNAQQQTTGQPQEASGGQGPLGRALRIAVLGSSTTTFLATALRMTAVRDGFAPEIYESPYGAFRQEILDPQSGLYAFAPQFVIIATHWRDAHLPAFGEPTAAEAVAGELAALWELLLSRLPCTVLQNNFELPLEESAGHLGFANAGGRPRQLLALNEALRARAPHGVVVVETDMLAAAVGKARWSDARQWYMNKQYPAAEALPALADAYLALIRALLGMAKKVLVLDLDNTLWGGVIGEDGLAGIRLGAPSAEGEAYVDFQRYLRELKERGVLLAVCSKNNDADARQPFAGHEAMVLREDDFVAFCANWQDKAGNLKQMAAQLRLGLDSFVFVDDNPVERELIRRELPQVAVVEINGADPAGYIAALQRGRYFESLALSDEDRLRHASYRANAEREHLQASATDTEAFLRQLDMRVSHGAFDERVFERVIQLLGKTNQFNLTTRRHSREQVQKLMADPAVWTQWFRLEDRFGDNGLIGLLIAVPIAGNGWQIDTFLMSCRVIGRRVEAYMIATLLRAARERGITRVVGQYLPTAKNAMVSDLYPQLGFRPAAGAEPGAYVFESADSLPQVPDCFARV